MGTRRTELLMIVRDVHVPSLSPKTSKKGICYMKMIEMNFISRTCIVNVLVSLIREFEQDFLLVVLARPVTWAERITCVMLVKKDMPDTIVKSKQNFFLYSVSS